MHSDPPYLSLSSKPFAPKRYADDDLTICNVLLAPTTANPLYEPFHPCLIPATWRYFAVCGPHIPKAARLENAYWRLWAKQANGRHLQATSLPQGGTTPLEERSLPTSCFSGLPKSLNKERHLRRVRFNAVVEQSRIRNEYGEVDWIATKKIRDSKSGTISSQIDSGLAGPLPSPSSAVKSIESLPLAALYPRARDVEIGTTVYHPPGIDLDSLDLCIRARKAQRDCKRLRDRGLRRIQAMERALLELFEMSQDEGDESEPLEIIRDADGFMVADQGSESQEGAVNKDGIVPMRKLIGSSL
ncbi:hypothetical protein FRC14_007176 [Serendipita sp. 396]|nr:hypothetical protein FRC14_007176 [Serendipita sp. 396]KAG8777102.1 hypothetical protein FRC15_011528 [Serendipita sp. 397]KAG8820072.1 hypothetical protein FRC18_011851 [Serendipita sp. 400]KAG8848341.1 hypothetical protein FRB91_010919 [Serendipita sp. 411]